MYRDQLLCPTPGRGFTELTDAIGEAVQRAGVADGLVHLFLHHTSASLILCENADPTVRDDLARFFARLAPDGDRIFRHVAEGPDDMPAHVRTVLTQNSLTLPVRRGRLDVGTWQGVYLWEHRTHAHRRRLTITVW